MCPASRFLARIATNLGAAAATLTIGVSLAPDALAQITQTYTVLGTTLPWSTSGSLNSAYSYGTMGGSDPVVVDLSSLGAVAGQSVSIQYQSGTVSPNTNGFPYTDANGDQGDVVNNNDPSQYGPAPSYYMPQASYPIFLTELVGTFADSSGAIVGTPFAIGNGPTAETVPAGATQLQLGANDDYYVDNGGSWAISVAASNSCQSNAVSAASGPTCQQSPRILMNGVDITNTTSTVAAGQQITLTVSTSSQALPRKRSRRDTGPQVWFISDPEDIVGGYSPSEDGPCTGQNSCISFANLTTSPTTFYWTKGGSGRVVTYKYPLTGGGTGSVSAEFNVEAPLYADVKTTFGTVYLKLSFDEILPYYKVGFGDLDKAGPGATFSPTALSPPDYPSGFYQWVQVLNRQYDVFTMPGEKTCTGNTKFGDIELDGSYPYDPSNRNSAPTPTRDSPHTKLPDVDFNKGSNYFTATMYLMWNSQTLNSIPVTLGSVTWGYKASESRVHPLFPWVLDSGGPDPEEAYFVPSSDLPQWGSVSIAMHHCIPPD